MKTLELFNGNGHLYSLPLPKITILEEHINEIALQHIAKQTNLVFEEDPCFGYSAQPTDCEQIVKLFLTYNYKTKFQNNATVQNTLFLKSDHHIGFKVNSICYNCAKENHIHWQPEPENKETARLAC